MQAVQTLVPTAMVANLILFLVFHIAALPFLKADSVQVLCALPQFKIFAFEIFDELAWTNQMYLSKEDIQSSLYENFMILKIDFRQ